MIKTRNSIYIYIYITLPILLLATLILGAIVLSGNNTANAQTKTGVQEVDRYWVYRNRIRPRIIRQSDKITFQVQMTGDARDIIKVKNYSKTGGNCHTKYKILSASSPTPPVVLVYDPNSLPADNKHSNTNIKRKSAGDDYDGHYFKAEFRDYNSGGINTARDRLICIPFGKTRRIADKYTFSSGNRNGWQIHRNLNGMNWDVVAHYYLPDANGEYVEVIHQHYGKFTNKDGTLITNKIQFERNGMYKVCALKFPTIHDPMKDVPQRICLDIDVAYPSNPAVYHCYVGMTQGDVSSVAPHSSNITIKAGSIKHEHSDKYKYGHARKQTAEIAIDNGGCNTYADGTSDYPAYASGIWKIYSYEYTNN